MTLITRDQMRPSRGNVRRIKVQFEGRTVTFFGGAA